MQKIAILSDIHGNIAALECVIRDLKTRGVGRVFNLGDHVSGPLWPKETIELLMKQEWIQIKGNHDRHLAEDDPANHGLSDAYAYKILSERERSWLSALHAFIKTKDGFVMFHGTPSNDSIFLLESTGQGKAWLSDQMDIEKRLGNTKSDVILCGHSHIPRVIVTADNSLIVNPGSVGLQAYDDDTPEYLVIETGSPHARYAILEYRNDCWMPELIAVPYDHHLAADQAHKNARSDWEIALLTGFLHPG